MKRYVEDPATGIINRLPPHAPAPDAAYQPLRFAQPPRALQSYLHGRDPRRVATRAAHGRATLYLARRQYAAEATLYLASRPGPYPDRQLHEILRPVTPDQLHGYAFAAVLRYVVQLHDVAGQLLGRRGFAPGDYPSARNFWQRLLLDEPTRPTTGELQLLLEVVPPGAQYRGQAVAVGQVLRAPIFTRLDELLPAFAAPA